MQIMLINLQLSTTFQLQLTHFPTQTSGVGTPPLAIPATTGGPKSWGPLFQGPQHIANLTYDSIKLHIFFFFQYNQKHRLVTKHYFFC